MLVLAQGKEIPALKRALPVFEEILAKKNLHLVPPYISSNAPAHSQFQSNGMVDASALPDPQISTAPSQVEQWMNNPPFYEDFLGLDAFNDWSLGDWN